MPESVSVVVVCGVADLFIVSCTVVFVALLSIIVWYGDGTANAVENSSVLSLIRMR